MERQGEKKARKEEALRKAEKEKARNVKDQGLKEKVNRKKKKETWEMIRWLYKFIDENKDEWKERAGRLRCKKTEKLLR